MWRIEGPCPAGWGWMGWPRAPSSCTLWQRQHTDMCRHGKLAFSIVTDFMVSCNTRKRSLLCLPCITLHGLRQAHATFILEVHHPLPETKECFSGAFIKFVCFIKGPIVPFLKQDYPSGVTHSAWVKQVGALRFHSQLLAVGLC